MTWLKGQTTYANLISDLTKLIAGEIADGAGTTASSGDRWVRPYTGVDYLQCPSAVALGNMSNRAGYWSLMSYGTSMAAPQSSVCKQTAIGTGTAPTARWHVQIQIEAANTTPGDYSTARYRYDVWDIDTGVNATLNSGLALTSSGTATPSPTYIGSVQITDPSGTLTVGARWCRSFTSTYRGGVDYFGPMFPKHTATPTFSVNPPGAAGTDYDVIERAGIVDAFTSFNSGALSGGNLHGVGVITNTYLTGARYTYTFSVAKHSLHLIPNASAGRIDLRWGGGYDNTNGRDYGHQKIVQWLQPYQTPASVTSASLVQYWISVKPDKVVIILNADPGQSGKLTLAAMGTYTPQNATYDKFPVWCSSAVRDYTSDQGTNNNFYGWMKPNGQKRRQDGSDVAVRDWQTGWARNDFWFGTAFSSSSGNGQGGNQYDPDTGAMGWTVLYPMLGQDLNSSAPTFGAVPARQPKPNPYDGNWWLYGYTLSAFSFAGSSAGMESIGPVGAITDKTLIVPGDGWSSGDEATETSTGKVWFLVAPDYISIPSRFRMGTNSYQGGLAVLEE